MVDSPEEAEMMEIEVTYPVLHGIAGECQVSNEGRLKVEGKTKAQLQANLFAVAGV